MISGCASGRINLNPNPSPAQLKTPEGVKASTAVRVSTRCRAHTRAQVSAPPWVGKQDPAVIIKRYDAALGHANEKLAAADSCIERQSREFATGLRKR